MKKEKVRQIWVLDLFLKMKIFSPFRRVVTDKSQATVKMYLRVADLLLDSEFLIIFHV